MSQMIMYYVKRVTCHDTNTELAAPQSFVTCVSSAVMEKYKLHMFTCARNSKYLSMLKIKKRTIMLLLVFSHIYSVVADVHFRCSYNGK